MTVDERLKKEVDEAQAKEAKWLTMNEDLVRAFDRVIERIHDGTLAKSDALNMIGYYATHQWTPDQ